MILSEGLRPVREFGRRGEGPGELSAPRAFGPELSRYRFLDVTDSAVYVYDGKAVEVFAHDGSFRRRIGGIVSGFIRPFTLLSIRREGPERRRSPTPVVRVELRSGHVETDTVPAFPKAFGGAGVYYAVQTDGSTEELLVTRYTLEPPGR